MFEFPTYIKVKRYRKKKNVEVGQNIWAIAKKCDYIHSKYIVGFYPKSDQNWVIRCLTPDKSEFKYYLVDDPQYKLYFDQYQTLSYPNNNLFSGLSLN